VILTVTPNPSLDLLFRADRLVWDDANRIPQPRRRPGGQGINVVRAVRALDPGASTLACAFLGGPTGRDLQEHLTREGTPVRVVPTQGETRVFVGTREAETGRSLLLNPRGPTVTPDEADALLAALAEALTAPARTTEHDPGDGSPRPQSPASRDIDARTWVIACGSIPPGMPTDFYAAIGRLAHEHGARFIPDCDGPALAAAASLADLLVPNDMEAARLAGRAVDSASHAVAAGRMLLESGPDRVVITLGARGAVAVTPDHAWWARPELPDTLAAEASEGTAVGAGDAFLAALLLSETEEEPERLARAVAAGTAVLLGRGDTLVDPDDVERVLPHVTVEPQDP
jgi:fructose-1-phosphate kinase PfkB-like protein